MTFADHADQSLCVAELVAQADLAVRQRNFQLSDSLFQQALERDRTAASRIAYGVCLSEQERYFEAISIFTAVLDGSDRAAIAVVCHNLAAIYREVGDPDLARRFQWRSTLLNEDLGTEELLGMANDAWIGGHPAAALSLVEAANSLLTSHQSGPDNDAELLGCWGLLNAADNSPSEGIKALRSTYCQHRSEGDQRRMGMDLFNMALVFGSIDRHRGARRCLQRAIRCFEESAATTSLRKAQAELARVDQMQKLRCFDARRN